MDRYTVEGRAVGKITGAGMGGVVLIVGEKHFMNEAQKTETGSFILSKMNTHGLQIQFFEWNSLYKVSKEVSKKSIF